MLQIMIVINITLSIIILVIMFLEKSRIDNRKIREDINALKNTVNFILDNQEKLERSLRNDITTSAKQGRDESASNLKNFREIITSSMRDISLMERNQLDIMTNQLTALVQTNEQKLNNMREALEKNLKMIQDDNEQKLEKIRITVDERLQTTLEQRLGESFKLVSERLELVHRGLGEMQNLAAGVGDLKKVLTNIKTRGIWGEIQLGSLLEQILAKEQYEENVITKKSSSFRVEFAIKLPGKDDLSQALYLPIDAKFPLEDYNRLLDAQEASDAALKEEAVKALEIRLKSEAKDIKEKYLDPPNTTDFGIMFLPIEGLYAEALRIPGLSETIQRDYRVIITGPTTLAALLNSLQMGFRTLAIEKRSSEVWQLLGTVKSEFIKFGAILDKTKKKLQEATNTIDTAAQKSRNIQRKLTNVQVLSIEDSDNIDNNEVVEE